MRWKLATTFAVLVAATAIVVSVEQRLEFEQRLRAVEQHLKDAQTHDEELFRRLTNLDGVVRKALGVP